jgi:hypothetical protein
MAITKNSLAGPGNMANLALVYAWTADRGFALEQLEIVAEFRPVQPTVISAFNPCWDSFRGDARFDRIIAAAKAATR